MSQEHTTAAGDIKAFTLRLKRPLVDTIDARAKANKRSRVAEVEFLLTALTKIPESHLLALIQES